MLVSWRTKSMGHIQRPNRRTRWKSKYSSKDSTKGVDQRGTFEGPLWRKVPKGPYIQMKTSKEGQNWRTALNWRNIQIKGSFLRARSNPSNHSRSDRWSKYQDRSQSQGTIRVPSQWKVKVLSLLLIAKEVIVRRIQIHSREIRKSKALCKWTYRAYDGRNYRKHRNISPWVEVEVWWKSNDQEFKGQKVSCSSRNKFRVVGSKVLKQHSKYQVNKWK